MARRHREVIWTTQDQVTFDEALAYLAQGSLTAVQRLLVSALESASSLSVMSERGRIVPELQNPAIRELLVQRYRLPYEVQEARVEILAFIHGARYFVDWQRSIAGGEAG